MHVEADSNEYRVLGRVLGSSGRGARLRGVAMLSHVQCDARAAWLDRALHDSDAEVCDTALAVIAWTLNDDVPSWPDRENVIDAADSALTAEPSLPDVAPEDEHLVWEWEYVVEVWRDDGLLVGVYPAKTCAEDEVHAGKIALGQAILATATSAGDLFDPATAATFITEKRRVRRTARPHRAGGGRGSKGIRG